MHESSYILSSFIYILNSTLRVKNVQNKGFPGGAVVENPPANAGGTSSIPGLGINQCRGATKPVRHNY